MLAQFSLLGKAPLRHQCHLWERSGQSFGAIPTVARSLGCPLHQPVEFRLAASGDLKGIPLRSRPAVRSEPLLFVHR